MISSEPIDVKQMGTVSCLAAHRSGESLQTNPDPHIHDSTDCNKPVQWDLLGVPSQDRYCYF